MRIVDRGDFEGPSSNALPRKQILAYGIGHMLNDLTAACWFTYLLIYLTDVGLTPREAALVMLSGQLADGLATISIGYLIDLFGHFKVWHGGGSLLVAVSFSSVFGGCFVCILIGRTTLFLETVGYSMFAAIFNIGWAATQVSHMSLVNCITANSTSRVALNSCRNAFTMIANLFLYAIAFLVFTFRAADHVQIQYRFIAAANIAVGGVFVIAFLIAVKEPRLQHHRDPTLLPKTGFVSWFRKALYYQVALVYTLTRLTTNVSQALLAFYLIDDLAMPNSSKAVVPAIIYICSFFTSICLQESHWTSSKLKAVFTMGSVLWICCGAAFFYLPTSLQVYIYPLAMVVGVANALMLVTATSMEGILVGHHLSGCAFVYGSLSLYDKLTCGMALYVIESFHDNSSPRMCLLNGECKPSLVRLILALVPGGCALAAAIISLTIRFETSTGNAEIDQHEQHSLREPLLLPVDSSSSSSSNSNSNITITQVIEAPRTAAQSKMQEIWVKLSHATVGRWGSVRDSWLLD